MKNMPRVTHGLGRPADLQDRCREGGIVKASRRLHRVQSSVTTRIRRLEASLGAELFYRSKQRFLLSPSGELLLGYAERLLRLSEEARQALDGAAPRGVFRLGALESTTASRLPAILAGYHAACPDVRVELTTGTNDALTAAVAQRRLDAAFVAEAPACRDWRTSFSSPSGCPDLGPFARAGAPPPTSPGTR